MIQINLLPDVKTEYIKTQRKKRMVLLASIAVSGVAIGLFVLQLGIIGTQKVVLSNTDKDIKKNVSKLEGTQDLNKILTIQNQITKLNELHAAKPAVSRIFTYLPQVTPNDVQINKVDFSVPESTMTISGTAGSIESINKFVDTLKFTKAVVDGGSPVPAFSTVVLQSYSTGNKDKGDSKPSYTVTFKYDSSFFDSSKQVSLQVPKIISTRSETERPNALFNQEAESKGQ